MQIQPIALAALAQANANFTRAAERLSRAAVEAGDSVSLSIAAVELLQAETSVEAALELIRTNDEIAEHALDVLG